MASDDASFVPTFVPLRQPVLGHVIERDPVGECHRVVDLECGRAIVAQGSLEECEAALVARLIGRHPARLNVAFPTFGGLQVWADVHWFADWRIQENVLTGHARLLDPTGTRRAWGSLSACRAQLERERAASKLAPASDDLVVLLHGLFRTRASLSRLDAALRADGYAVAAVNYPSTRRSIAEHADGLERLLDGLEEVRRVSFVTHSLGGLVARATLARDAAWRRRTEVGRLVMIAPPSHGSSFADALADFLPFRLLAGRGGQSIAHEARAIPLPTCPFGVIAARTPANRGLNPFIEGADDGIVGVEEARLAEADDFLVVTGLHSFVMGAEDVVQATRRFFRTGSFACASA